MNLEEFKDKALKLGWTLTDDGLYDKSCMEPKDGYMFGQESSIFFMKYSEQFENILKEIEEIHNPFNKKYRIKE